MEGFAKEAIERGEVFALSFKEKMPSRSICLVTGETGLMSMAGKNLLKQFRIAEHDYQPVDDRLFEECTYHDR